MLRTGLLTRVFDPSMAVRIVEKMKDKYGSLWTRRRVKTYNFRIPVEALRVSNSSSKSYDEISTVLDGAPKTKEESETTTQRVTLMNSKPSTESFNASSMSLLVVDDEK